MDTATTVQYVVHPTSSRFTVRAFASGLLSGFGHSPTFAVRDVSGEVTLASEALDGYSVTLEIPAAALSVQDDVNDKDRREIERAMRDDVLEVGKFPAIRFSSAGGAVDKVNDGRYRAEVPGELTLHGVTRPFRVPVQVFVSNDALRVQGEFTLRQSDFGIKLVSVAGGALKVKDELKGSFDLVARKR